MSKGFPFPDVQRLEAEMMVRGWTREALAQRAGISAATTSRLLAGRRVSVDTIERIAVALLAHPPATATAMFLTSTPPTGAGASASAPPP